LSDNTLRDRADKTAKTHDMSINENNTTTCSSIDNTETRVYVGMLRVYKHNPNCCYFHWLNNVLHQANGKIVN